MSSFKDTAGRDWQIAVNVGTLRRIKKHLDVDLMGLVVKGNGLIDRMAVDAVLICDLLFVVVMEQAETLGITDEQFGASQDGDTLVAGLECLIEGVVNFSHSTKRKVLRHIKEQVNKQTPRVEKAVNDAIASGKIASIVEAEIDAILEPLKSG